jgi:hypothetical protein
LLTGDVEVPANPHELITDETGSNQDKKHRPKGIKNKISQENFISFFRSENYEYTKDRNK